MLEDGEKASIHWEKVISGVNTLGAPAVLDRMRPSVAEMHRLNGEYDLAIKSEDTDIIISVQDKKDAGSNTFVLCVGDNVTGADFNMYFMTLYCFIYHFVAISPALLQLRRNVKTTLVPVRGSCRFLVFNAL